MLTGPRKTIEQARRLHRELTLPEGLLWRALRQRPGGFKFRRQHPAGRYVLDFFTAEVRVAVEVDGFAHDTGDRPQRDEGRDRWLDGQGVKVLRIPAKAVLDDIDAVVLHVIDICRQRKPLHRPADGPPPRSGEEL
jgi:very-short-patch-repair endonuclease